jgi:hypothetical protein
MQADSVAYGPTLPTLALSGGVVPAANSNPSNPPAAGGDLGWVAGGFGTLRLGDNKIPECVFAVYDAPYAECKRRAAKA